MVASVADLEGLRSELRHEMAEHRGAIVRYVSERDAKLMTLIGSVRDEVVQEVRNVKETLTNPDKWAETTAVREFRREHFGAIETRAKKAERGRTIAIAAAGGIAVLAPAIAKLLEAVAQWVTHLAH